MHDFATSVRRLPSLPQDLIRSLWSVTETLCFWLAVGLPLVYLPLVVLAPSAAARPTVLVGSIGANLLALAIGHDYEPGHFLRRRSAE